MTPSAKNKDFLSWSPGRYPKQRLWFVYSSFSVYLSSWTPFAHCNLFILLQHSRTWNYFFKGKKKKPQTSEKYYIFSSYLPLPTKVSVDHSYLNTHPVQTNLRVPVYMELACMCKFAYLQIFLTYRYVDKHFLLSRKPFTHVSLISLCP